MKLADLKRIPVGTKLLLVHCLMGPVEADKQPRTVREVRSNALLMDKPGTERPSWLYFPKAAYFRDDGDGFAVLEDHPKNAGEKIVGAQYKFAPKNEEKIG